MNPSRTHIPVKAAENGDFYRHGAIEYCLRRWNWRANARPQSYRARIGFDMTTSGDDLELIPPGALPDGLYVREAAALDGREPTAGHSNARQTRQWRITGRNPDFCWELIITHWRGVGRWYEMHCTRCGLSDQAVAISDLLGVVWAGAHLHGIDPASRG